MKLAVAFGLAAGVPEAEFLVTLDAAATEEGTGVLIAIEVATLDAGVGVAEVTPDDVCTARPTSGCFPDTGVVLSPQLDPAAFSVLPYMRQRL